jgi:hypothetical protein
MNATLTKKAAETLQRKIAAADARDEQHAIDYGFLTACQDMGLTETQTAGLAKVARERLENWLAKKAETTTAGKGNHGVTGLPDGKHHGSGDHQQNIPEGVGQGDTVSAGQDNKGSGDNMNTGAHHSNGDNSTARVGSTATGPAKTPAGK